MTSSTVARAHSGLRCEISPSGVAMLTFDRPDRRNAIDWPLYTELVERIESIGRDTSVKVVVLRGAGGSFCAGGDIAFMRQMFSGEIDKADVQAVQVRLVTAQLGLPQPMIAVVDGPAVGLGCTIALSCDLVLAAESATFCDPHVQMGLVPGDGGALLWSLLAGPARAKEFLFTGDPVTAAEAARLGLVNRVLPDSRLHEEASALAERLAAGPQETIRAIKTLVNQNVRALAEHCVRPGLALESLSQASDYHHRAVEGFLAGRPLRF